MLNVKNITKKFGKYIAVNNISFDIQKGEIFGLVGESGSGKSTTARLIARLITPDKGEIYFNGENILGYEKTKLKQLKRQIQIIFQDPFASLNPRMRVKDLICEPLLIHDICKRSDFRIKTEELLLQAGLSGKYLDRYPHELSGGECQRVCIAKCLALNPSFLVLDEPVSSLDYSMQDKIINMFLKIKNELSLTYLFITHDILLARKLCSRVAVMKDGKIIESGKTDDIFTSPQEEYTRQLVKDSI